MDYENKLLLAHMEEASDNEKFKVFYESAEKDNEPDYELLRKHIEQWTQLNPYDMAEFMQHKKDTLKNNANDTGASKSKSVRHLMDLPQGLYRLLSVLSPNFLGARELTQKARLKRIKTFVKKFPAFRMCKKL